MKKIAMISFIFLSWLALIQPSFAKANEQALDQIVAVVNDDVITTSELNQAIESASSEISRSGQTLPPAKVLKKQVLDQLINKKLQLQMAHAAGIEVTDDDLNKAIARIAEQNHVSVSALYERVAQDGMTSKEYRHEIKNQMTMHKLQQMEVASHITISQDEVNNFIQSEAWRTNGSKEYHLEDILIPLSDAPSSDDVAQAQKRANAIVAELHRGRSFKDVAQSESSGKNALQGGDLGWRKIPEIPSAFVEQVSRMQANEIAGPIQTPNGFHVIRLVAVRSTDKKAAAPDRQQIEEYLFQRKFEEASQNWVSKLRSQAFIKINE